MDVKTGDITLKYSRFSLFGDEYCKIRIKG